MISTPMRQQYHIKPNDKQLKMFELWRQYTKYLYEKVLPQVNDHLLHIPWQKRHDVNVSICGWAQLPIKEWNDKDKTFIPLQIRHSLLKYVCDLFTTDKIQKCIYTMPFPPYDDAARGWTVKIPKAILNCQREDAGTGATLFGTVFDRSVMDCEGIILPNVFNHDCMLEYSRHSGYWLYMNKDEFQKMDTTVVESNECTYELQKAKHTIKGNHIFMCILLMYISRS
jgi:hypothetical protein